MIYFYCGGFFFLLLFAYAGWYHYKKHQRSKYPQDSYPLW